MSLTIPCTLFGTVAFGLTTKEQTGNLQRNVLWFLPVGASRQKQINLIA
jgi:hypothetical protein